MNHYEEIEKLSIYDPIVNACLKKYKLNYNSYLECIEEMVLVLSKENKNINKQLLKYVMKYRSKELIKKD